MRVVVEEQLCRTVGLLGGFVIITIYIRVRVRVGR